MIWPTTIEDGAVIVPVLNNDHDGDGDLLTVAAITQPPTIGSATFTSDSVEYIPNNDQCGTDTFSYQIDDSQGGTDTAVVTITITCVNDNPVAVDDSATTNENTAVSINVLANDFDVDLDLLTCDFRNVTNDRNGRDQHRQHHHLHTNPWI